MKWVFTNTSESEDWWQVLLRMHLVIYLIKNDITIEDFQQFTIKIWLHGWGKGIVLTGHAPCLDYLSNFLCWILIWVYMQEFGSGGSYMGDFCEDLPEAPHVQ